MRSLIAVSFLGILSLVSASASAAELIERQPGNLESWIALCIVLGSVLAAWFLNHRAPQVRVLGTLLAAAGCFALSGWFFLYVTNTGFLESPKPYDAPMDAAKPSLLWLQCSTALLVGFALLLVARQQSRDNRELVLSRENEAGRYGRVSRILHWTTAILFIVMIPMGIYATIIPEGVPYRLEYYVVHKTIGVIIFALVIARLAWNRISRRPPLDTALKPMERKLAHGVHFALYGMLLALPITGFIMTSYFGAPSYFFAWEMAPLWEPSEKAVLAWGLLHKYLLPYLIYVILGAHILGALKHQFVDRHSTAFKRMVS